MKPITNAYHESKETPAEEAREHRTGKEEFPPSKGSIKHQRAMHKCPSCGRLHRRSSRR